MSAGENISQDIFGINVKSMEKKTKEKSKRRLALIEKLRNTPADKLSQTAKWMLKREDSNEEYWMDMRAVLK